MDPLQHKVHSWLNTPPETPLPPDAPQIVTRRWLNKTRLLIEQLDAQISALRSQPSVMRQELESICNILDAHKIPTHHLSTAQRLELLLEQKNIANRTRVNTPTSPLSAIERP